MEVVIKVPVFKASVYGGPAVFHLKQSDTLLIFAERRDTIGEPSSRLTVARGVLKRTLRRVTMKWKEQQLVNEAHLDGHCSVNPCPVYEEKTNQLFLFFTCVEASCIEEWQKDNSCTKSRLCYVTSQDCGVNWSKVTDLTGCLPEDCITFSVRSGHGLQTEDGRLIVPAYIYKDGENVYGKLVPHAVTLYSDDGGESWQFGSVIPEKPPKRQTAEGWVDGGKFTYCNQQGRRVEAVRDLKGDTFTLPSSRKLPDTPPGCQGSVISFPANDPASAESQSPEKWLLFSHPIGQPERMDLAVFLNKAPFNPKTWRKPWILKIAASGPSDLIYIDDGCFACVFQENSDQISLRVFHINEIKAESQICRIM